MKLRKLRILTLLLRTRQGWRLVKCVCAAIGVFLLSGKVSAKRPLGRFLASWLGVMSMFYGPLGGDARPNWDRYDEVYADWFEGLVKYIHSYFPTKLELQGDLKKGQNYIFASHPHGAMGIHGGYLHGVKHKEMEEAVPRSKRRLLAASVHFVLPIYRDFAMTWGAVDASYSTAKECLQHGLSIELMPGGEREMLMARYGKDSIFVGHLGFCRLALKCGVPIVPCYCFGETSTYHTSSLLLSWRQRISRTFRIAMPLVYGDDSFFLGPIKTPLTIVVGDPIPVEQNHNPSHQEVVDLHAKYLSALTNLFEKNKKRFGYNHELDILHEDVVKTRSKL
uniref:Acyltransferase n=1 Tax=Mucochytrium quahogii TaxID=96639 RepID=A0A7S2RSM6_9STRA|mmetsp:Transcript_12603/g.20355  ORF Transcript_12603/g.20355 Transcript_12603/m.20355 type:complete len:336 (+) Transcript_12603:408-1415(+)|eukprot:CAMPEP_0203761498 /NCGR_PEP_ID=MMETSP0098-20131031/14576_1 /ASSEMBLY_ACC=CAM_ASM_000208 /TAXON_ID=96639 /ORGANISM=" , Strain NY0313808BC1" /LENGTH=335 /DNA_ID=CAMNT_0050655521 /DNA_START=263 /DNA_END=1270 /DNA_ORIENTATION=-